MIVDIFRTLKLFTDDQYVTDHLYEEVYPNYIIPYYTVPVLTDNNYKDFFPALTTTLNNNVEMIDYTKMLEHPTFVKYCERYLKNMRYVNAVHLMQIDSKKYITDNFPTIPVIVDPNTLQTNIRKVVEANLAAFSKLNLMLTEQKLIDQVNSV